MNFDFKGRKAEIWRMILVSIGLALLLWGCIVVLRPFIPALIWAIILCLTTWPAFVWLKGKLRGRGGWAALWMTTLLALAFVLPLMFLSTSLADDFLTLKDFFMGVLEAESIPLPLWAAELPLIGPFLTEIWPRYFGDTYAFEQTMQDLSEPITNVLIQTGSSIGHGVLDLSLGILIAFFFFRHGDVVAERLAVMVQRFAGERGQRLLSVSKKTMVGVVYGLMGAALAQGTIAGIGFAIAGIPGAPFLGLMTFILSFIPFGPPLLWVPAAAWLFSEQQIGMGVFMTLWGILVSSVDNIIRPYFISLESALPFLLVLLGVLGGILAFGFIGLFIGPTLLALAYTLAIEWSAAERPRKDASASDPSI